jgi:hypothetical protein
MTLRMRKYRAHNDVRVTVVFIIPAVELLHALLILSALYQMSVPPLLPGHPIPMSAILCSEEVVVVFGTLHPDVRDSFNELRVS